MTLLILAVAAQLGDLISYNPATEANPIVNDLGDWAPAAKIALVVLLVSMWCIGERLPRGTKAQHMTTLALCMAIAVGVVGMASNVL